MKSGSSRSAEQPRRDEQREPTRRALGALVVPVFFVVLFSLCIIGAYHSPHPNDIKVGVVGPAALTAPLRAKLDVSTGSVFEITKVSSIDDAIRQVRARDLDAAFVPTADPTQPATVVVATAGGRIVATAAETLARSVTTPQGAQLVVRDVRPLHGGDQIGLGIFLFTIICTIGGYLAATVLYTVAPDLEPRRRSAMLVAVAVATPVIAYLIAGLGFGTYTGSVGEIFGFLGVGALYTLVVTLVTRMLQVLLGPVAIFASLTIFVFLNIPSLGATYTASTLPSFWRFLNGFWIGADAVNAERSILYFDGLDVATYLLRLVAWTGVVVALVGALVALDRRRASTAGGRSRVAPSAGGMRAARPGVGAVPQR